MFPFGKKTPSKTLSRVKTTFHSVFAVIVLSAFVLGISYFVRELSLLTPTKLAAVSQPVLDKLGVSNETAGEVAGDFAKRAEPPAAVEAPKSVEEEKEALFSIAVFADVHSDLENLRAAVSKTRDLEINTVFLLGDETDLGVPKDLAAVKKVMDDSGLTYYALPGDRDLYDTVGQQAFLDVFGVNYHSVGIGGKKFVLLDNSANFTIVLGNLIDWFVREVADADFVLLSQPLYHPSNDKVMGVVDGEEDAAVRKQALELLDVIRASPVVAVVAGDHHMSSTSPDPVDTQLTHYVVGAITRERNLQPPRFGVLTIFTDGDYEVKDVVL